MLRSLSLSRDPALAAASAAPSRLPAALERILRRTSRSIYLTLRAAPRPMRRTLMLGYLFCRAADTIADTRVLPPSMRLDILGRYRAQFEAESPRAAELAAIAGLAGGSGSAAGFLPAERELLWSLPACFAVYGELVQGDRALLRRLLPTLTRGMELDLLSFPAEEEAWRSGAVRALADDAELDRYCYHVAGCVGEFWTDLQAAHLESLASLDPEAMRGQGVRFGKGLQMTNVLRDLPADLRLGRCYLPRSRLEPAGVDPVELRAAVVAADARQPEPAALATRLQPVLDDLLDLTLEHYRAGWRYTLTIPRRERRLRLACAWPLLIGLATLALLRQRGAAALLRGERLKISRWRVYRILAASLLRSRSDAALEAMYTRAERGASRPSTA